MASISDAKATVLELGMRRHGLLYGVLGGVLIAGLGWRAIFLVTLPLGILTFLLAHRHLPVDRREPKIDRAGFDHVGTLLLALTLAAYALAMTIGGRGSAPVNLPLLLTAEIGRAHV